jgi:penicillin-binding protein 1A
MKLRIFIMTIVASALLVFGGYVYIGSELPKLRNVADYQPPQATRIYSDDGQIVGRIFKERRTVVPLKSIPQHVIHAFIAAEDAHFYQHKGLDYLGILRAVVKNLRPGAHLQGASTITQQTVKTLVVGSERSLVRKFREAALALQVEKFLTKDEILYIYLNQIYFGAGAYGVEEAAQTYFGKSVKDVSVAEAAYLAAAPKHPSYYSLKAHPGAAKKRQIYVLQQMLTNGWISAQAAEKAIQEPPLVPFKNPPYLAQGPHYVEHVKQLLISKYGEEKMLTGGLVIYTGMKASAQKAAHEAVRTGLEEIGRTQGWPGATLRIPPDRLNHTKEILHQTFALQIEKLGAFGAPYADPQKYVWDLAGIDANRLKEDARLDDSIIVKELTDDLHVVALVTQIDENTATVDLGSFSGKISLKTLAWARAFNPTEWTKPPRKMREVLQKGDLVNVEIKKISVVTRSKTKQKVIEIELVPIPRAEGALVSIDPDTRLVRALVGGYSMDPGGLNRALAALRQPGSAFKPVVYTAGLQAHVITPASICNDSPISYEDPWTGKVWRPENFEGGAYDGNITYRTALKRSKNICSVKLIEKLGADKVITTARALGIRSKLPNNLTLALGSGDTTPIELANAYTTLAAAGRVAEPIFIRKVVDSNGITLEETKVSEQAAIDPAVVYIMTSMLRSVVEEGTATRALALGRPVVGKTGTSNESRNTWFSGFSPDLEATVWVGFDDNSPMGQMTGSSAALPIWVRYMKDALAGVAAHEFVRPNGVVTVKVDAITGEPSETGIDEVFLPGTEPTVSSEGEPKAPLPDVFNLDDGIAGSPAP